jgi:hypothetical protein
MFSIGDYIMVPEAYGRLHPFTPYRVTKVGSSYIRVWLPNHDGESGTIAIEFAKGMPADEINLDDLV